MWKYASLLSLTLLACSALPAETESSSNSADSACRTCPLAWDGYVVVARVPDAEHLEQIVRDFPDHGSRIETSYYAQLDDGRVYYKSWLYVIEITDWDGPHPNRGRIVGARSRAANDWQFADGLAPPWTSTAVVLGTWEDEAKNALSMKWIPSALPLGAVVLPSKQTFARNFVTASQPEAYAGLIACATGMRDHMHEYGDDTACFEALDACNDAEADRNRVLDQYRLEMGGDPTLVVGISAGTFVAQELGEKLGGVETHLFGTPRFACKGGNDVACHGGDVYASRDGGQPYCENGPELSATAFYRNNPHDRVPGSFFDNWQVVAAPWDKQNPWHDYSNWSFGGAPGRDRFRRTEYENCDYPVVKGDHPYCTDYPYDFGSCVMP